MNNGNMHTLKTTRHERFYQLCSR